MVIAVSLLVLVALAVVAWAVVELARRTLKWTVSSSTPSHRGARPASRRATQTTEKDTAPAFGPLRPLGPVGPLGGLSPDADINSASMDEHDLYGA